jgi:hypothetical protein
MTGFPPPLLLVGLLALAVVVAWLQLALWRWRAPPLERARSWRLALLAALQPVAVTLLYLTLVPPRLPGAAGTLVVATADAPQLAALAAGDALVALPEAPALLGAERVPDLATALRRHPGTIRLRIIGQGLPSRDRAATGGLPLVFAPTPLPRGLQALALPPQVAPGATFRVGGTVGGVPGGRVELRDPAGRAIGSATLSESSAFVLAGTARVAGSADFSLRIRDAGGTLLETAAVPVVAVVAPAPRLLVVAGAAGPDLKYLRRWAIDAGVALGTSIAAGGGLDVGDAPARLDPATLARLDLLVLDERSWTTLSGGDRSNVLAAVRGGLGVVLRVTGPVSDPTRRQWAALGLPLGNAPGLLRLPGAAPDAAVEMTRLPLGAAPSDTAALLEDIAGAPAGAWRGLGRGRIGLWPVTDLYALALAGDTGRHAELWSEIFGTLARTGGIAAPLILANGARERVTLCDLSFPAAVLGPDGATTTLFVDRAASGCAAFWPARPGWHTVQSGTKAWPFHVETPGPGLVAAEARTATWQLQAQHRSAAVAGVRGGDRGSPWPWFAGWLLVTALLWWLERARLGRPTPSSRLPGSE